MIIRFRSKPGLPKYRTRGTKTKFLFFPKILDNPITGDPELRWLITTTWDRVVDLKYGGVSPKTYWRSIRWTIPE